MSICEEPGLDSVDVVSLAESPDDREPQWAANRAATLREAKERMREMVADGYYPLAQLGGTPMVTMDESIDD